MSISILQKAHAVISSSGGTVSFPAPTTAGSVVVWMISWPGFVGSFFPTSDDAGNNVVGRTAGSSTIDFPATVGSESWFGILKNGSSCFCLPMQTLTLTGASHGNVSVWMFELAGMKSFNPSSGADAEYFTQQYAGNSWNDLNGSAQNPMNSSAGTSYGGTNDPFSHSYRASDATIEYFIVSCIAPTTQGGGSAAIASVAAPFTLEPVQQGFGCAWKISTSGYDPVGDRAVFTNGGAAFYSAQWIALAGTTPPPTLSVTPSSLKYISHEWAFSPAVGDGVGIDGTAYSQTLNITASGAWTLSSDEPWVVFGPLQTATFSGSGNATVAVNIRDRMQGQSLFPSSVYPQFPYANGKYTATLSLTDGVTTVDIPVTFVQGLG